MGNGKRFTLWFAFASTAVLVMVASHRALADELELKGGSLLKGEVLEQDFQSQTIQFRHLGGGESTFRFSDVQNIKIESDKTALTKDAKSDGSDLVEPIAQSAATQVGSPSHQNGHPQKKKLGIFERMGWTWQWAKPKAHIQHVFSVATGRVGYGLSDEYDADDGLPYLSVRVVDFSWQYTLKPRWVLDSGIYVGDSAAFEDRSGTSREAHGIEQKTPYEAVRLTGLRAGVLYGRGLTHQGFRLYGGAGVYREVVKFDPIDPNSSEDQSVALGPSLRAGIGYSTNRFQLEYWVAIRDGAPSGSMYTGRSDQYGVSFGYRF